MGITANYPVQYYRTWEEHVDILTKVFERVKDSGLKVKFAKCVWAASECRVLGSVVSEHGIKPDRDKVAGANQLPVPRNVADVRCFLGAAGYFHEHLLNFAKTTAPLRALLKMGVPFSRDPSCQQAFETLKQQLVSSDTTQRFVSLLVSLLGHSTKQNA